MVTVNCIKLKPISEFWLSFCINLPFDTVVTVLDGQLFLRLISSKQLSAHIHKHTNGETRLDNLIPVAKRNLEVDSATKAGRKSVNRDQDYTILWFSS